MRKWVIAVILGLGTAGAAVADTVLTGREAQRALFKTRGFDVAISQIDALSEQDKTILANLTEIDVPIGGAQLKYYGAIAFSPSEGILAPSIVLAANHHALEPARAAAIAACNDNKESGSARCVIAAEIIPRRYEPGRAIQLNMDATNAVGKEYRRLRGDKAFSISNETGEWGFGASDAEAQAACAAKGATDCRVVLRN